MSWGNSGLARKLDHDLEDIRESYYLEDVFDGIYVKDQVAIDLSRTRIRASAFVRLFFLFFVYGVALVFLSNTISTLGYDIAGMQKDITALNEKNKRLEVEISSLKSLERIEQVAVSELHMVRSGRKDSMVIENSAAGRNEASISSDSQSMTAAETDWSQRLLEWLQKQIDSI